MGRVNARRRRNPLPKCSLCKDGGESLSRYGYTCFCSYCEVHNTALEQQANKISVWRRPKIRHPASVFMFSSCYAFMLKLSVIFPGYLLSLLCVFSVCILCSASATLSIKQGSHALEPGLKCRYSERGEGVSCRRGRQARNGLGKIAAILSAFLFLFLSLIALHR